ncbi:hypothetical protein ATI02_1875 [Pseudomonas baetica]|uniref:Uncharacterized protein n=1 Tax=Pseudomonas baetica TaxID=674054 RepID=A0ABX4PVH0_9PSED|nr:hypothetical protein ATI02_1851 [Pseudomonas baetica]PKA69047.1 hypothetical protein ATI02_1863 [Pseudomonas baetica]PKA69057.1 hypothetical protein ATI02_1875 [Pseudomonas baetica]
MDRKECRALRRLRSCRRNRSVRTDTTPLARIDFKNETVIPNLCNNIALILSRLRNLLWGFSVKSTFLRVWNIWQVSICFKHAIRFAAFRGGTTTMIASYFNYDYVRHVMPLSQCWKARDSARLAVCPTGRNDFRVAPESQKLTLAALSSNRLIRKVSQYSSHNIICNAFY